MEPNAVTGICTAMNATYNTPLVVFSIVIAVFGSYTSLDLAGQVPVSRGIRKMLWLIGGAIALGNSISAMHLIATLAYQLPIPVIWNCDRLWVAIVIATVGSGLGFFVTRRQSPNVSELLVGGVLIGLAIIGMHFAAMSAIQIEASIFYDLKLVAISSACAVVFSCSALWLAFHSDAQKNVQENIRQIGSAFLAGTAIYGMHFIGIAALSFQPSLTPTKPVFSLVDNSTPAIATGIVLALALVASSTNQRLRGEMVRVEALRQSEERYQNLYDFAPDGYFTIAADSKITSVNQTGAEYLGYRKEELIVESGLIKVYKADRKWVRQWFAKVFREKLVSSEIELREVRKDGSLFWVHQESRLLFDASGTPTELRIIGRDITQRKLIEDQLWHNAFHDPLTNLPNRALFIERLSQAIEQTKLHQDYLFAVLFLDLDRFKVINDSLGHQLGDQLLIAIADRLLTCLPTAMVARLGGDEFTILVENIKDIGDAVCLAEQIQTALILPFDLGKAEVFTSASIGITLSTIGYEYPQDMLRDADTAMYRAKALGKARAEIFSPDMHVQAVALLQIETDLRLAIEHQEFCLHYQPIVSLKTGKLTGFEALVRWQHPQHGLIFPSEFILVAEENGLIPQIDFWVLGIACKTLHQWQLQLPLTSSLTMSVNLSSKQFAQPHLINQIERVIQQTGLDASSLRLEITESALIENPESATAMLLLLRKLGVQLSIDDFGTGYSSLSRLHNLPINGLKIDRSFVTQMGIGANRAEIVETILTLARKIGVDVTAKGVETKEHLVKLRALKCEYGQGYYFSQPLDREAAAALIMANPQW